AVPKAANKAKVATSFKLEKFEISINRSLHRMGNASHGSTRHGVEASGQKNGTEPQALAGVEEMEFPSACGHAGSSPQPSPSGSSPGC
ncbi:MAG: hypothetical protein VX668_08015, partial [Planctomycetota bacterium]|nr:hypothetical protein [Planctomycetota bacterium]